MRCALVSAERLPRYSVSTWASASVEAAPAMARSPSPAMPSMSSSTLSVTMSCRSATRNATWPGTTTPALAERLEADHRARHAHVEGLGPPRHRDGDGSAQRAAQRGVEPRGLVAEEQRSRHRPVERGVVVTATHHGGHGAKPGVGQLAGQRPRLVPHRERNVEDASRPRPAPSWGCRDRPSRRRRRRPSTLRRPRPAARCRRCPGRARRPAPPRARPDEPVDATRPGPPPTRRAWATWAARREPAAA